VGVKRRLFQQNGARPLPKQEPLAKEKIFIISYYNLSFPFPD
jgi:hypothetical protein